MEETGISRDQPFIADDEAPKVAQPGKRPLDNLLAFFLGDSWRYDTSPGRF